MPSFEEDRFLAHFLGPKGENDRLLEELLIQVLRDYSHWRRNYFPQDSSLITHQLQRQLESETEAIRQKVNIMLAELRRSFPFYSPRYIAHQQSETSLASLIGTVAGSLYNSNNVTPESGAVTVEWEMDACNSILSMIGFNPPPQPPRHKGEVEAYFRMLEKEFAWCHLTSGGTVANIEALWVARAIRYFPLAVRDAAQTGNILVEVKSPAGVTSDLRKIDEVEVLKLKPNECIYLLSKFILSIKQASGIDVSEASSRAWDLINESKFSLAKGVGNAFARYPPVIFSSGAAHYSVKKAADLLGMGRDAVEIVDVDTSFRMDVRDLKIKIEQAMKQGRVPVAVIAVAGTTEEGSVDPIDRILELRREMEKVHGQSFWLHVDGAWGGFIRSLYVYASEGRAGDNIPDDLLAKRVSKISKRLGLEFDGDLPGWVSKVFDGLPINENSLSKKERLLAVLSQRKYHQFLNMLRALLPDLKTSDGAELGPDDFKISREDRIDCVGDFVREDLEISVGTYRRDITLQWAQYDVGMAICAIERADSVTIDPHKLGYTVYPCGAVAFKNDRVRHFITQEAPYITSQRANVLVHKPPRYSSELPTDFADSKVATVAFAPFTLEGSRPGASACSLWLASQTLPFNREHHGTVVRSSLLAARALYEWLRIWDRIMSDLGEDPDYQFTPLSVGPPDTNIVIFGVKKRNSRSLRIYNDLSIRVYNHFSIQGELGQRSYSYSQPFFLSKTWFREPYYPANSLKSFFERFDFRNYAVDYPKLGLVVLRATVMNPYLMSLKKREKQDILKGFVRELAEVSASEVREV